MTKLDLILLIALLGISATTTVAILYWLVSVTVMVWGVL